MSAEGEPSSSRHYRGRPSSSGKTGSAAFLRPRLEKGIQRRNRIPYPESEIVKVGNNKVITPLVKAQFGAPSSKHDAETYDLMPDDPEHTFLSLTLRERKVQLLKLVGDEMRMVDDTEFAVELYENSTFSHYKKLRAAFNFREDQVQIWVTFFREVSKVKIHKFYSQTEPDHPQTVVWTFTFPNGADVSAQQAKFFCTKLRYACERMSLTKLAYSNVDRKAVAPAAQGNFHPMMSSSETSSMLPLIDEADEHPDDDGREESFRTPSTATKHLKIVIDRSGVRDEDWVFTGALNDPKLVAMIEKFGIGWDIDGRSQPSAIKKKRKSKKRLTEDQECEKSQQELHKETIVKTKQISNRKRSLSPDNSHAHGGRKRADSRSRGGR